MTMFEKLRMLQQKAYAIYSNYHVACILKDDKDNYFEGVNIENSAYGVTICAERSAIACAVSAGSRHFTEAHIICGNHQEFGTPCGMCRQTLAEFMNDDGKIFIYNVNGDVKTYLFREILPDCFRKNYFDKE